MLMKFLRANMVLFIGFIVVVAMSVLIGNITQTDERSPYEEYQRSTSGWVEQLTDHLSIFLTESGYIAPVEGADTLTDDELDRVLALVRYPGYPSDSDAFPVMEAVDFSTYTRAEKIAVLEQGGKYNGASFKTVPQPRTYVIFGMQFGPQTWDNIVKFLPRLLPLLYGIGLILFVWLCVRFWRWRRTEL
jgi:hypothetical protein